MKAKNTISGICAALLFVFVGSLIGHGRNFVITGDPDDDLMIQFAVIIFLFIFPHIYKWLFYSKQTELDKEIGQIGNGCGHDDYGPVQLSGYQYCRVCGVARPVALPCCKQHKWEVVEKIEIPSTTTAGIIKGELSEIVFINRCENCGDIQEKRIKVKD